MTYNSELAMIFFPFRTGRSFHVKRFPVAWALNLWSPPSPAQPALQNSSAAVEISGPSCGEISACEIVVNFLPTIILFGSSLPTSVGQRPEHAGVIKNSRRNRNAMFLSGPNLRFRLAPHRIPHRSQITESARAARLYRHVLYVSAKAETIYICCTGSFLVRTVFTHVYGR
jgi:hypothetical protein